MLDDGLTVQLGSAKQQAILAVLLLHANEVVTRERLIDELWGERPPATAVKSVQVYVSQLRKQLPRDRSTITTHGDGYRVELLPDELDAIRFEGMVAAARARAAAGAADEACRLFEQALALWRGRALAGLSFESYASTDVERLEELRVAAVMDRIDCELALGRHDRVIGELEQLVAEHPLHERLSLQLMLALYRAGRQADALHVYRRTRETLVSELAIEPGKPLRDLEAAILRQETSLAPSLPEPRPRAAPAADPVQRDVRRTRTIPSDRGSATEPGKATGERRIVSVLVADVAGSTSIAGKLGIERSQFLFDEVTRLMREEVERFGGTVAQLTGTASWRSSARPWRTTTTPSAPSARPSRSTKRSPNTAPRSPLRTESSSPRASPSTRARSWSRRETRRRTSSPPRSATPATSPRACKRWASW